MTGEVSSRQEAVVEIILLDAEGRSMPVRAVMDTGFTGYITLPADHVSRLELSRLDTTRVVLGDGSQAWVRVYEAAILWDGDERIVSVHATDGVPLIGMSPLRGYHLGIDVVDGGLVSITRLTP